MTDRQTFITVGQNIDRKTPVDYALNRGRNLLKITSQNI